MTFMLEKMNLLHDVADFFSIQLNVFRFLVLLLVLLLFHDRWMS